jgi:hypothetical protein
MCGSFLCILFYACETWMTTRADLALIRKARNRLLRQALGIVTKQYLHVLASTADVIIEQRRLSLFGHVARFWLYQNMAQPVLKLLWHVPQRPCVEAKATARPAASCGSAMVSKILLNSEEIADLSTAVEFSKWSLTSGPPQGAPRVGIIGLSEPRAALLQISHSSSALQAFPCHLSESCLVGAQRILTT